jgi:hypothetical protein
VCIDTEGVCVDIHRGYPPISQVPASKGARERKEKNRSLNALAPWGIENDDQRRCALH